MLVIKPLNKVLKELLHTKICIRSNCFSNIFSVVFYVIF